MYAERCCSRQIFEAEVCHVTKQGSSSCSTRSKQSGWRVATAWSAAFAESSLCPRPFFGFMSSLYSGGTFNLWLEGWERNPTSRKVSKGWQRRMCQVPENPFNRVLLRQIYLQIWNLERQLSLSRYILTSRGTILIIDPFKLVQQKWIKLNSLLKLPEASQLSNEFL